ncbi:MAG: alkaline phosphatase family protein, partial [Sedimentisphaerales bacterium]|nr:alkaline phosphatase family protein [Sedimentisphaerales bacterium]
MAHKKNISRREFLKQSAIATATVTSGIGTGKTYAKKRSAANGKKVIVIGIDGMDPVLSEELMDAGKLPTFDKLRKLGGFRALGSSIPPQTPVAWSNFINGAGPGSHGIFDFIHRNPEKQFHGLFLSTSETVSGQGYWEVGDHKLQFDFWPFNHKLAETVLRRQGTPFWEYLDKAGINSVFYDLPCNYPPSPSKYGNHKCLAGMGTPDMLGNYGGYHYFSEDGPVRTVEREGCRLSMLFFENEAATGALIGPPNTLLKEPKQMTVDFQVYRDTDINTGIIEIQDKKIILKPGQWSKWITLEFELEMPVFMPNKTLNGICRFYLQEVSPNFRLYVTPINTDPSAPEIKLSEPIDFSEDISKDLGLFYTSGFQEDYKALQNEVFTEDEYVEQAEIVLQERLNLLEYAMKHYEDGLLYFYFSSTDMQAHMLWWDSDEEHPTRSKEAAKKYFEHVKTIYERMDGVLKRIIDKYAKEATVIVISDHGFANFKRQFGLNKWLLDNGYIGPSDCKSLMTDADWSGTRAYGLGINGLYLNLKGRERDGIVEPGQEQEELLEELITKLQAVKDKNGKKVIKEVYRTDKCYSGPATRLAPD